MKTRPRPDTRQLEALGEIINLGLHASCDTLNTLLMARLDIRLVGSPTHARVGMGEKPSENEDVQLCQVHLRFNGLISGTGVFSLARPQTRLLLEKLTSHEVGPGILDTLDAGTISEIGSIFLDGITSSLSRTLGLNLVFQMPSFRQGTGNGVLPMCLGEPWTILESEAVITYAQLEIPAKILFYIEEAACHCLLDRLDERILGRV